MTYIYRYTIEGRSRDCSSYCEEFDDLFDAIHAMNKHREKAGATILVSDIICSETNKIVCVPRGIF